ncbi:MAG: MFS transporter [Burkholderiales bacterium]|jgi:MFS family permease|nr:MFS transporter [Burkholderiales bacterium]
MNPLTPRIGVYFALLQLLFTLTWTVYVIFLPRLAAEAGIPKSWILWILVADQLVFVIADWLMGARADRMSRVVGRLGPRLALVTLVSALAFLLLPFAAPLASPVLLLALTFVWTITSSALRAPPLMLIGKYAASGARPVISGLWLFGFGVAGAMAPYLTIALRDADPRLPFALASVSVAIAAWALGWAERSLAAAAPATEAPVRKPLPIPGFLAVIALAALGFQLHFSLSSAPQYLRFVTTEQLGQLMPAFWVGFNLAMLPLTLLIRRYGDFRILAAGALAGALAVLYATQAASLALLIAAQVAAGAAWAAVMFGAFGAAMLLGRTGREGFATGGLFSMLAFAAMLRILLIATQLNQDAGLQQALAYLPAACWGASAALLLLLLRAGRAAA